MNIVKYGYIAIACLALGTYISLYCGALQDLYQATFDMRDQFAGTATTIQSTVSSNQENIFAITGTLQMMSADVSLLTTKTGIDASDLTIVELLKTILYKLSTMA